MSKALIGITPFQEPVANQPSKQVLSAYYTDAVSRAGGIPIMIPVNLPKSDLTALVDQLDGIILSGGGDIEIHHFGGQPNPKINLIDPGRDEMEIALVKIMVGRLKPFLGICRGAQVINVALGGTLHTDIADQVDGALKHDYFPDCVRGHLAHIVTLTPDSRLADLCGATSFQVNSLHHQACKRLAADLKLTAYAPDGIIEAFEMQGHPFGLGVQWHPENLLDSPQASALFEALTAAASSEAL
jgi:putative glutamine amidotransferase